MLRLETEIDSSEVSFPLRVRCVYYRPTDLARFPLLVSAAFLVCNQNNTRLNLSSVTAQFAPPQLKLLTSIHLSILTLLARLIIENSNIIFYRLYANDNCRSKLVIKPGNGPHCEGIGPEIGHLIQVPRTGLFI
jgi:hypothetical protein